MRQYLGSAALLSLVVCLAASLAGCGGSARLLTRDEEIRAGRTAAAQFEAQNGGRDCDTRRNALALTMGARIGGAASADGNPDYPYECRVLANDEVNANAFPGGIIYLWRGLFPALGYDEAQLAWVVGHEAAHVSRQHAVRRIERALGYELIIQLVLGQDQQNRVAQAMANLTLQDYGPTQEVEADRIGAEFAHNAGYDPTAALAALQAFKSLGRAADRTELQFATEAGNCTREENLKAYFRKQGWNGKYFRP